MEPFFIVCTTCNSRLRVQDESAIGQILACPKCGSMVHINQPDQEDTDDTPPSSTPSDSPGNNNVDPPQKTFRFREDFSEDDSKPSSRWRGDRKPNHSEEGSTLPGGHWGSVATGRLRQWFLVIVAAIGGLLAAIFVFSLWVDDSGSTAIDSTESQENVQHDVTPTPSEGDGSSESGDADAPSEPSDDSAVPATDGHHGDDAESPESSIPANDAVVGKAGASEDPPDEPVAKAPSETGNGLDENAESAVSADGHGKVEQSPDDVKPVVDEAHPESADVDEDTDEMPPQLQLAIESIQFDDISLSSFGELVSELASIPVTLDVDSLRATDVSVDASIELNVSDTTIADMLKQALEPIGLVFSCRQGQLLVSAPKSDVEASQRKMYAIDDLANSDGEIRLLAKQLMTLVAPETWQDVGGLGALKVEGQSLTVVQTSWVHYEIARFLDKLRSARGLPPRSNLSKLVVGVEPVFRRVEDQLGEPVTISLLGPTRLQTIMNRLRSETELNILVDWRMLASEDWLPGSQATVDAEPTVLGRWLDSWLFAKNLAYRVIDEHTLQVNTASALASHPEFEVYTVASPPESDVQIEVLIDQLKLAVGQKHFRDVGGPGAVLFDKPSASLLVSLPQPQQRLVAAWVEISGIGETETE